MQPRYIIDSSSFATTVPSVFSLLEASAYFRPNPEEVMDIAWVTADELKAKMAQVSSKSTHGVLLVVMHSALNISVSLSSLQAEYILCVYHERGVQSVYDGRGK